MNSVYNKEIIFAKTKERAESKLLQIVESLNGGSDPILRVSRDFLETERRQIRAVLIGQNCRGYRCSFAHVDCDITIRELRELICPILIGRRPDEYPYRWEDRIIYF